MTTNVAYDPKCAQSLDDIVLQQFARFVKTQLESDDVMSSEEETYYSESVCEISTKNRWRLYRKWVKRQCSKLEQDSKTDLIKLEKVCARQTELELQKDKVAMKSHKVIGMTTTCAAKYHSILSKVIKPRIVIIEEAAQVFETHIISCLSPFCDQLILIGDQYQLRPKPSNYNLNKYDLDVSLFERMVLNDIPYVCLQVQHRMRPIIADISRHIYPDLKDHDVVKLYSNVKGIAKNLFCVSHKFNETYHEEQKSYSNEREARFVVALTKYIIQQGYDTSKITVLTTYTSQLFLLNRLIKTEILEVQNLTVSVVDNYQGEENEIVILSLVRSNAEGRIGFLNKPNRICVALSRAKIGLYIIGNMEQLAQQSRLWKQITTSLKKEELISDGIPLYCQNHPEKTISASSHEDFRKVPEGGCQKPCDSSLDCGHFCDRKCHINKSNHICRRPCRKRCAKGHRCTKKCYELCGPCNVKIVVTLKCGHVTTIPCHKEDGGIACNIDCNKPLNCGHLCKKKCHENCASCIITYKASLLRCKHETLITCGEPKLAICKKKCEQKLECGHECKAVCGEREKQESKTENFIECDLGHITVCLERCDTVLACKHRCTGKCVTCYEKRFHQKCTKQCNCDLACGHACKDTCGECFPCERMCGNLCPHGQCSKPCKELCEQCKQPCLWKCLHFSCTARCGDMCVRPRCNQPCMKNPSCGHQCIGLCGEPCPSSCLTCDEIFLKRIGIITDENLSPCVIQLEECKHLVEYRELDNYMDEEENVIRLKRCPVCLAPIRHSTRYGNVVKKILLEIENLKYNADKAAAVEHNFNMNMKYKNIRSIRLCLEEIKTYFMDNTDNDFFDQTFLDKVILGDEFHEYNVVDLTNKQVIIDATKEIQRCFDMTVLKNLESNCISSGLSSKIHFYMKKVILRRQYDETLRKNVTDLISKLRSKTEGAEMVLLEIKIVEANAEEDKVEENTNIVSKTTQLQRQAQDVSGSTSRKKEPGENTPFQRTFHLKLFSKKNLPYYNCGKSQMVKHERQTDWCKDDTLTQRLTGMSSRKTRANHKDKTVHLKRQCSPDHYTVCRCEAKKRKLTNNEEDKSKQFLKKKCDRERERYSLVAVRKCKRAVPYALPEKKMKMATVQSKQEITQNNDDKQAIIEAMLKSCDGSDAVVKITDTYHDTRIVKEVSKNEPKIVHEHLQLAESKTVFDSSIPPLPTISRITESTEFKAQQMSKFVQDDKPISYSEKDLRNKLLSRKASDLRNVLPTISRITESTEFKAQQMSKFVQDDKPISYSEKDLRNKLSSRKASDLRNVLPTISRITESTEFKAQQMLKFVQDDKPISYSEKDLRNKLSSRKATDLRNVLEKQRSAKSFQSLTKTSYYDARDLIYSKTPSDQPDKRSFETTVYSKTQTQGIYT